jgi:hypothetical protein
VLHAVKSNRIGFSLNALGKKMAPTFGESRPKFASFGRMGMMPHRPSNVRRTLISLHFDFSRSDGRHKKAEFRDSKAAGGTQPAALPSSPHTGHFLQRHQLGRRTMQLLRPILRLKKGDARPDRKRISVARRLFCDFAQSHFRLWKREAPMGVRGQV